MQQSYQICSQNDVDRRGGMQDAFITVCAPFFSFSSSFVSRRRAGGRGFRRLGPCKYGFACDLSGR